MSKPVFNFNLDLESPEIGSARALLAATQSQTTYESTYNLRHPLGVYNVSIHRISSRVERLAKRVNQYMVETTTLAKDGQPDDRIDLIADDIEACIYATAEHVDDLEHCLRCFFPSNSEFSKSKIVKSFKGDLRPIRNRVSTFANAIKHAQARIRLFLLGFIHNDVPQVFMGFFVEGVRDGVIGPSPIAHGDTEEVVALPAFLWEVIFFVERAGDLLTDAVAALFGEAASDRSRLRFPALKEGLIETAKMPNFNFDREHPFSETNIGFHGFKFAETFVASDLYGSIGNKWSDSETHAFDGMESGFRGDGVSRQFTLVTPKRVGLQHWAPSDQHKKPRVCSI